MSIALTTWKSTPSDARRTTSADGLDENGGDADTGDETFVAVSLGEDETVATPRCLISRSSSELVGDASPSEILVKPSPDMILKMVVQGGLFDRLDVQHQSPGEQRGNCVVIGAQAFSHPSLMRPKTENWWLM